jgi:CubicO group peptidase (beta-lactamase class C family)
VYAAALSRGARVLISHFEDSSGAAIPATPADATAVVLCLSLQENIPTWRIVAPVFARNVHVLLSNGYGFADLEWDIPNSPTTKFRLGSVTKQFTAACILLLEERGKLKGDVS